VAKNTASARRIDGRRAAELRPIAFQSGIAPRAAGSVLCSFGRTRVICAASFERDVPRWMKEQGVTGGWVTAEYSMLPYSTAPRKPRDITKGRIDGRSQEIQRLIGRSLRAVVDLEALGPRSLVVDCDVLEADGGTRTASITGAFLAVALACHQLVTSGELASQPLKDTIAAVSVGRVEEKILADLCYVEDAAAEMDMNVVATGRGRVVEVQAGAEESALRREEFDAMLDLALASTRRLARQQQQFLKDHQITLEKCA
jgi:ribonuclease PH